jgi:hypothetical protein
VQASNNPNPPISQAAWALAYINLGAAVLPCSANKTPLIAGGVHRASRDPAQIQAWWAQWPYAEIGIAVANSVVVVDLDCKRGCDGLKDFRGLEDKDPLEIETPIASTPTAGLHVYYRAGEHAFRNKVKVNGFAIDVRAVGGYVIAPGHNNGRKWLRPPTGPWAPAPKWLETGTREPSRTVKPAHAIDNASFSSDIRSATRASRYGKAALEGVTTDILNASDGGQETAFDYGTCKIASLVASRDLPESALETVLAAALAMPNYDPRWPWTPAHIKWKFNRAVAYGMSRPYHPAGKT